MAKQIQVQAVWAVMYDDKIAWGDVYYTTREGAERAIAEYQLNADERGASRYAPRLVGTLRD